MMYSLSDLRALASSVGFPDPALAAAVSMAESGGNTCAQGDPSTGDHRCDGPNGTSTSFGLWQVHTPANPQYDPASLLDPMYNARAALEISRGGKLWTPWTTYKTGAYRQWYQPGGYETVVPPERSTRGSPVLTAVAVLGMAAAAGYAIHEARASTRGARS